MCESHFHLLIETHHLHPPPPLHSTSTPPQPSALAHFLAFFRIMQWVELGSELGLYLHLKPIISFQQLINLHSFSLSLHFSPPTPTFSCVHSPLLLLPKVLILITVSIHESRKAFFFCTHSPFLFLSFSLPCS